MKFNIILAVLANLILASAIIRTFKVPQILVNYYSFKAERRMVLISGSLFLWIAYRLWG